MASDDQILEFIRSTFPSVWSLELLIFLADHSDREWSEPELIAAIRGSDLIIAQSLASLVAAGLVTSDQGGKSRYNPVSGDLALLAENAKALYAKSPNAVRRMIIASAHDGLAAFADAFRLRKD